MIRSLLLLTMTLAVVALALAASSDARPLAIRAVDVRSGSVQTFTAPKLDADMNRVLVAGCVNGQRMLGCADHGAVVLTGSRIAARVTNQSVTVASLGGSGHVVISWSLPERQASQPRTPHYEGVQALFPPAHLSFNLPST